MSLVDLVTHLNGFILVAYGHLQLINELVMFLGGPSLTVFKSLNKKKIHTILKSLNFLHFSTCLTVERLRSYVSICAKEESYSL